MNNAVTFLPLGTLGLLEWAATWWLQATILLTIGLYIVTCTRSLELLDKPPSTLMIAEWCSQLGQELFRPPNVGGWPGGRGWLNSRTIVARANFGVALLSGELHAPPQPADLQRLVVAHCEPNGMATRELFETLLLSGPSRIDTTLAEDNPRALVTQLLSSPQAFLN